MTMSQNIGSKPITKYYCKMGNIRGFIFWIYLRFAGGTQITDNVTMLQHGTYKLSDREFKTQQISPILKSAKI